MEIKECFHLQQSAITTRSRFVTGFVVVVFVAFVCVLSSHMLCFDCFVFEIRVLPLFRYNILIEKRIASLKSPSYIIIDRKAVGGYVMSLKRCNLEARLNY